MDTMLAVVYTGVGGPDVVDIRPVARPEPEADDLLVRVHASALNRADILQRQGDYAVPAGQSSIPGVEVAGTVVAWGDDVSGYRGGERVFGVVEGGGLAEYCLLDKAMANRIPDTWGYREAAATAESWLTANETLFTLGNLAPGERVLVHASASGIGTTMVQMARMTGASVYATVGSEVKRAAVLALGAQAVIDYRQHDYVVQLRQLTGDRGMDLVMDVLGGREFSRNLSVLRDGGRLVLVGLLDGLAAPLDLLDVVERRLHIMGSSLRLRPMAEKRGVNSRFRDRWIDRLQRDEVRPVIHAEFPLSSIRAAQHEMERRRNIGKIVIRVTDQPSP
jgi:putative PIG3 family NAD(P)H quinone oxidoreductase